MGDGRDGRSRQRGDEWDALLAVMPPACRQMVLRALAQRDMRPTLEELVAAEARISTLEGLLREARSHVARFTDHAPRCSAPACECLLGPLLARLDTALSEDATP